MTVRLRVVAGNPAAADANCTFSQNVGETLTDVRQFSSCKLCDGPMLIFLITIARNIHLLPQLHTLVDT